MGMCALIKEKRWEVQQRHPGDRGTVFICISQTLLGKADERHKSGPLTDTESTGLNHEWRVGQKLSAADG